MHALIFLQDLAVVMIVAALVTLLFHRFKQPVVLGYILAGVIIGPHMLPSPLIQDETSIQTLAEIGIVFLMFSLGLEFNLRKLKQVGPPAAIAAVLEIALMTAVGYALGRGFGWNSMDSIFLGAMLAISSTTIIVKALGDLGLSREPFANLIFGILVIEDVLAIVMIALLSSIAMTGTMSLAEIGTTVARLGTFLVTALVIGLIAVPRLLAAVARFKSNEMLLITVLGLCFGSALLAVKLGYSVALGAFVIGAVIAESRELGRIVHLTEPLRDMFSAVFFVAIGLLIDPAMLRTHALPIAIVTVAVLAGKILSCSLGTFLVGTDSRTSLRVGMGLAQIGEFSFIIAALGVNLKVTSDFLYPIAVAVSVLTTVTTPLLMRSADGVVSRLDRHLPRAWTDGLALYTRWVHELRRAIPRHPDFSPVRSLLWQIALNVTLLCGVFISAALASHGVARSLPWLDRLPGGARTACWVGAVVITLPIYVATIRKLEALGMLLAEISTSGPGVARRARRLRPLLARLLFGTSLVLLALMTAALSIAIEPPARVLIPLLVLVALAVIFFGAHINRLYSRGKFALIETWNTPPIPLEELEHPLPSLLRDAALETAVIETGRLAGKRIGDTQLRTLTGASIVALERAGSRVVNPGPDETIQVGDRVLLLGDPRQLAAARELMGPVVDPR